MTRNFDLIRLILRAIESKPAGVPYTNISVFAEYDPATVYAHFDLLIDAGFLKGRMAKTMKGLAGVHINELTWLGHDFLNASADDSLWKKAKDTVLKPGVSFTFDILLEWLKTQAAIILTLS